MSDILKIAISGAAGQVAYSFLPRLASGSVFGRDKKMELRLLETPEGLKRLKGVVMEINDCSFPLVENITAGSNYEEIFLDIDFAFLIGALPRRHGMQRADLLNANGPIFKKQGQALNKYAKRDAKVVVVGNPANTNCFICYKNAPSLDPKNFSSLTFLDYNRAKVQLARKAGVNVDDIKCLATWGNHSFTQYPDLENAKIKDASLMEVINDKIWLKGEFMHKLQERGAAIIEARGVSSAMSAANAIVDHTKQMISPTEENNFFGAGVVSDGSYGIDEGLVFSFPVKSDGNCNFEIVKDLDHSEWAEEKIQITLDELRKEKEMVKEMFI